MAQHSLRTIALAYRDMSYDEYVAQMAPSGSMPKIEEDPKEHKSGDDFSEGASPKLSLD